MSIPKPGGPLLHDLDRPEHLLVWSLRAIALGNPTHPTCCSSDSLQNEILRLSRS
jgi:hypothetical protein